LEDLGPADVTSLCVPEDAPGRAAIVARQTLVLAGSATTHAIFDRVDPRTRVEFEVQDGTEVEAGTRVGFLEGKARSLLRGERTALNFLQRLSGVATLTRRAVRALGDETACKLVDTRKTTPGMRALEKAAVRAGGGHNHRFGLFDGVLIKDNHIAAAGGVQKAVEAARARAHHLLRIEVECDRLDQVDEALTAGADVILLDNMSDEKLAEAVQRIGSRALTEASGGVTLDRLGRIAAAGVQFVSMGALTHSAPAVDLGLDWDA
jgi:nicotinate-nucleotide pyrophosphorylase (carboxylating)